MVMRVSVLQINMSQATVGELLHFTAALLSPEPFLTDEGSSTIATEELPNHCVVGSNVISRLLRRAHGIVHSA